MVLSAAAAYDLMEQKAKHFHSGINDPGEVSGMLGRLGISCERTSTALLEALEERAGGPACLFVDSGAFSEVSFATGAPVVAKPITHAEWMRRLDIYARMAAAYRTRCFIVAPDQVGNQEVTLSRLATYAHIIRAIAHTHRCQVIVPVQKGALSMAEFFARELQVLQLGNDKAGDPIYPIAGIPMKSDATSLEDLAEFAAQMPPGARFHLLGCGPAALKDGYRKALAAILDNCPGADITSDSGTIRRLVGRSNGRGGAPRAMTAAQDAARAAGHEGSAVKHVACRNVSMSLYRAELAEVTAAGWVDPELAEEPAEQLSLFPVVTTNPAVTTQEPAMNTLDTSKLATLEDALLEAGAIPQRGEEKSFLLRATIVTFAGDGTIFARAGYSSFAVTPAMLLRWVGDACAKPLRTYEKPVPVRQVVEVDRHNQLVLVNGRPNQLINDGRGRDPIEAVEEYLGHPVEYAEPEEAEEDGSFIFKVWLHDECDCEECQPRLSPPLAKGTPIVIHDDHQMHGTYVGPHAGIPHYHDVETLEGSRYVYPTWQITRFRRGA